MKKLILIIVVFLAFFVAILPQTNIIVPQMFNRHDFIFGGNRDDIGSVLFQDNSYIVSGRKCYFQGLFKLWQYAYICKMSPNGDLLWELTDVDSTDALSNSLAIAPNGDIFWAILVPGNVNKPSMIYRISPQGNIVWQKVIDKIPADGVINAIATDSNYLIVAQGNNQTRKIMIFDHDGNLLFEPWYLSLQFITGLIVKDNYLYISGHKPGGIISNYQSEIYKINFSGNIIWSDIIQDMTYPRIVFGNDNHLYLSGRYSADGQGASHDWMRIVKFDNETGQRIWERYWNGDNPPVSGQTFNCNPLSIAVHPEGGVVVAGYSQKFGAVDINSTDAVAVSYDSQGDERFKIRYDYEPNWFVADFSAALFEGNTLVAFGKAAENYNSGFLRQLFFTKWNNVTGVEPEPGILPTDYQLYQNYPNPFNPTTTIKFSTPLGTHCVLKVFNLLGKEMETLVDEYLPAGNYSVQFTGQNLPSGIYIYELRTENFSTAKKMTVIK